MRIIRRQDYTRHPWKNGGGITHEIAADPVGASIDDFNWRISMAVVASDGPFSSFVGVSRILFVVRGAGVVLTIDGQDQRVLPQGDLAQFHGTAKVNARLFNGAITDLNIMTRDGAFSAEAHYLAGTKPTRLPGTNATRLIFSTTANINLGSGLLSPLDCLYLDSGEQLDLPPFAGSAICIDLVPLT